jgi:hypothetical protein
MALIQAQREKHRAPVMNLNAPWVPLYSATEQGEQHWAEDFGNT